MTADDLISNLRACGPQTLHITFNYLADRIPEARLADGQQLCDATDFIAWLRELGEAARTPEGYARPVMTLRLEQSRSRYDDDHTCPRCGHIHQGSAECGEPLGGGRVCRCEMEVPA